MAKAQAEKAAAEAAEAKAKAEAAAEVEAEDEDYLGEPESEPECLQDLDSDDPEYTPPKKEKKFNLFASAPRSKKKSSGTPGRSRKDSSGGGITPRGSPGKRRGESGGGSRGGSPQKRRSVNVGGNAKKYHAKCIESGCDWRGRKSRFFDHLRKKHGLSPEECKERVRFVLNSMMSQYAENKHLNSEDDEDDDVRLIFY